MHAGGLQPELSGKIEDLLLLQTMTSSLARQNHTRHRNPVSRRIGASTTVFFEITLESAKVAFDGMRTRLDVLPVAIRSQVRCEF